MPWTSRAAAAVVVVSGILSFAASPTAAAPAPLSSDPSVSQSGAAHWLGSQIGADGLVESITTPGSPDLNATAYAALGLATARSGHDLAQLAATALSTRVDELVIESGADVPGKLSLLILLNEALGQNPRAFGGVDLVARLTATMQTTGADAGLFGSQFAVYDGPFRQGLALAALSLVDPLPAELSGPGGVDASLPVTWLLGQQCADGSWMYRPDTSVPCAFDPDTFAGPDTNATALALLGLKALGATLTTDQLLDPLAWLEQVKSSDGGWSLYGGAATASDPDSTGLVLAAFRAAGSGAPSTPAATSRLMSLQFGCASADDERGAFFFPPWNAGDPEVPNLLSTYDAVIGLAPGTWPSLLTTGTWTAAPAAAPCPAPATTTTTAAPTTTTTTTTPTVPSTTTTALAVVETASTSSASSAPNALAATGRASAPLALGGLALTVAGAVLLAARRRTSR